MATIPQPEAREPVQPTRSRPDLMRWSLRIGLAGIFLSNGIGAWNDPSSYMDLMRNSFLGLVVRDLLPLAKFVMVNDLVLGVLILLGMWSRYVLAYAGLWLIAASLMRFWAIFVAPRLGQT